MTVLDINMGYYNINILPASQDMTIIVTEFGKFRYNRLRMGMCASGYILQDKVDELPGDIEDVKIYINDILVLSKEILSKNIEQLRIVFSILHSAGLKSMLLNEVLG